MHNRPVLVYADAQGHLIDWPELEMAGSAGGRWRRLQPEDWIPLPDGSELFLLPKRLPVGYDWRKQRFQTLSRDPFDDSKSIQAVAAFVAPAHTQIYSAAYRALPEAPVLPLFAYTAVGWHDGRFVAACLRIDADERQDFCHFNLEQIARNARRRMRRESHNRLVQHLGKCALSYGCPAARNLFLNRWEAPLPSSPRCNARCLGCISLQENQEICATQDRITFVPTAEEIAEVAVPHLQHAVQPVVSFGQGCEGEPLLQAETLIQATRLMRQTTRCGTINLNTNASLPEHIKRLAAAGLDSMRVSLNSCRSEYYHAYYRPRGYGFEEVVQSIRVMKQHGKFVSLNYFVLPGFTDAPAEWEALQHLIHKTGPDLIQLRNFNIDPEWYLRTLQIKPTRTALGIRQLIERIKDRFPDVRLGYFNPCLNPEPGNGA